MPITVMRDDERRRMTATASGVLSPAELLEFFHAHRTGDLAKYQLLFNAIAATARARPEDVQALVNEVATDAAAPAPFVGPWPSWPATRCSIWRTCTRRCAKGRACTSSACSGTRTKPGQWLGW